MKYKYALVGNPNCGKTTLFNELTGSKQYVGNWPGVTVEKKEGEVLNSKGEVVVVDLPGIYSLSPYSMEEIIARDFIIEEKPDLIINIVDATNLERNLYLSLQLAELGTPMVIALNMIDIVEKRGDIIDYSLLSSLLGITIIPISASKNIGINKLLSVAQHEIVHAKNPYHFDMHTNSGTIPKIYTGIVKTAVEQVEKIIKENCILHGLPLRWSAVKLIEDDKPTLEKLNLSCTQISCLGAIIESLEAENIDREMAIADQKYKYICSIREKVLKRGVNSDDITISDKIDKVVTNKYLAIPFFFGIMGFIFYITFGPIGSFFTDTIEEFIIPVFIEHTRNFLISLNASSWAVGLVCDGILGGVGTVLTFFPQILILFFFMSLLEDSGYMARAAFVMDKMFHSLGLSGKSFVPLIMGFGCSVPAIMATRTLETEKDRRLTAMLVPFMSCGAKMFVYSLFIVAFFPTHKWLIVSSLYLLGIIVAMVCAFILQKTVLKGAHAPFILELPPYRMPTAKTLSLHLWEKVKDFLTKAGTVLLGASIVIWFCQYYDFSLNHVQDSSQSILGVIGGFIAPIFTPLGFGNWEASVALLSGFVAKESIVSSLGILYGAGSSESLVSVLNNVFTPASAYSFMVFCLLSIPCVAAVITLFKEMKSVKWASLSLIMQMCVSWIVTFIVYNIALIVF